MSNFQCVVVIVVPELSVKGCARQEDLRMPQCRGVDVKSKREIEQWNFGCRGAQLELGWNWHREGLAQGSCGLTDPAFLSEEDLSCWNGAERRPPVEAEEQMPLSAGSQGSYKGRQLVRARGIYVTFLSFTEGRCA